MTVQTLNESLHLSRGCTAVFCLSISAPCCGGVWMDSVVLGGFWRHYIASQPANAQTHICACPSLYGRTHPCGVLQRKTKRLHHRSASFNYAAASFPTLVIYWWKARHPFENMCWLARVWTVFVLEPLRTDVEKSNQQQDRCLLFVVLD